MTQMTWNPHTPPFFMGKVVFNRGFRLAAWDLVPKARIERVANIPVISTVQSIFKVEDTRTLKLNGSIHSLFLKYHISLVTRALFFLPCSKGPIPCTHCFYPKFPPLPPGILVPQYCTNETHIKTHSCCVNKHWCHPEMDGGGFKDLKPSPIQK